MGDFAAGVGYLLKGQRWVTRHGRWWAFGMFPAMITLIGYLTVLAVLAIWSGDVADALTPFANHWGSPWEGLVRGAVVAALVGGGVLLALVTFTAVTLLIGQPFYESLCARVDDAEGGAPDAREVPLWQELALSAQGSALVLLRMAVVSVLLFCCGFIPVVGETVAPVVGFCVSGFYLTAELTAVALQRRGVPHRDQLWLLRRRPALALGFGVPLVLLFLIPLVTVLAMPGAVAGATLLARDLAPVGSPEGGQA